MTSAVLSGLRVVEISAGLPGALAGMYLADQGADVIRLEAPDGGPTHPVWDRGKRSVRLDLTDAGGRAALAALLDTAQVVSTGVAPSTLDRLGLDAAATRAGRPGLIHCSITGYGRTGPERDRPGYDALVAARHGLQWDQPSYRRDEGGEWLDGAPIFLHLPLPSYGAAFLAVTGIAAALFARARSGQGATVETSLAQGAALFTTMWRLRADHEPPNFQLLPRTARGTVYECADGAWVHVMHLGPSPARMLDLFGVVPDGPVTPLSVMSPPPPVEAAIRAGFRRFDRPELLRRFGDLGIPVVAVQAAREMFSHPQLLHNAMVLDVEDPELGPTRQTGIPFVLERNPTGVRGGRPLPGEHTRAVLTELGL